MIPLRNLNGFSGMAALRFSLVFTPSRRFTLLNRHHYRHR